MKMVEIRKELVKIYKTHFPHSMIALSSGCLSDTADVLFIRPLIGNGREEFSSNIVQNDAFYCLGTLTLQPDGSFILDLKPTISSLRPVNPSYYCSSVKIKCQIVKGDIAKILSGFTKIIKKLRDEFDKQVSADNFLKLPFDPKTK